MRKDYLVNVSFVSTDEATIKDKEDRVVSILIENAIKFLRKKETTNND
jgi:hypothetical protein